ncbi:zeta toxin family protein [Streptomyces sp. NPDC051366]|uniref:zeta toxin family protein n=1 Tax=Streptomyces sp. NPDC051366 TaxID=3365652 RepID=UPI003789FD11
MTDPSRQRYALTEEENRRVFEQEIRPELYADSTELPRAVLLGGQCGAGKSSMRRALEHEFDPVSAVVLGTDILRVKHPRYHDLLYDDDQTASFYTSLDARRWVDQAVEHCMTQSYHVIMDGTLSRTSESMNRIGQFVAAGYAVDIVLLAVPYCVSMLGNLERHYWLCELDTGRGRICRRETHEASYRGMLDTAKVIEGKPHGSSVRVVRRDGMLLYENSCTELGGWLRRPELAARIIAERERIRSSEESEKFLQVYRSLRDRMLESDDSWRAWFDDVWARAEPLLTAV